MKFSMKKIATAITMMSISYSGFAVKIDCEQIDDQMRVQISELDASCSQFSMLAKESGQEKSYDLPNQEKTSYTTPKGFFDPSRKATIKLTVKEARGRVKYSTTCTYHAPQRTSNNPRRTPPATPFNNQQTYNNQNRPNEANHQQNRNQDGMSEAKIANYAEQQARTVANRVVEAYGAREAYKASFTNGLNTALVANRLFNFSSSQYNPGYNEGQNRAQVEGHEIGAKAAKADAVRLAKIDAKNAQLTRNNGRQPSVNVPNPNWATASFMLPTEHYRNDLETRVRNEYESSFIYDIKKMHWGSDDYFLAYDDSFSFNLWTALGFNGRYNMTQSSLRDENAFSEWKNNNLGRKTYDYNLYNKMSESEKRTFKNYFCRIYNQVIGEKLEKRARQIDATAYASGLYWGKKISDSENFYKGSQDGFNASIASAAMQSYNSIFSQRYLEKFNAEMRYYSSNAVIEATFIVKPSRSNPGQLSFDIEAHIANIGDVDFGDGQLKLASDSFSHVGDFFGINIAAHSNKKMKFKNALVLTRPVIAGETQVITVRLDSIRSTMSVAVEFGPLLSAYADSKGQPQNGIYQQSILMSLQKEWNDNSSTFQADIYAARIEALEKHHAVRFGTCLLGDLVTMARNKPELLDLRFAIENMDRPGSFWHFNKNASFKKLLSQLH